MRRREFLKSSVFACASAVWIHPHWIDQNLSRGAIMKKEELSVAVERARKIFQQLMNKYKGAKGYLVFSSPYGQCSVTSDIKEILTELPEMVIDSNYKEKGLLLIQKIQDLEADRRTSFSTEARETITKKIWSALDDLGTIHEELDFKDDTFIEIRFSRHMLDLIFAMQSDPLVSQKHTPQTRASVRIVLGTLAELSVHSEA